MPQAVTDSGRAGPGEPQRAQQSHTRGWDSCAECRGLCNVPWSGASHAVPSVPSVLPNTSCPRGWGPPGLAEQTLWLRHFGFPQTTWSCPLPTQQSSASKCSRLWYGWWSLPSASGLTLVPDRKTSCVELHGKVSKQQGKATSYSFWK